MISLWNTSTLRPRDAVAYIMDTFPVVRCRDEEKFNDDYRTRRVILEIYDAMQESIRTGKPYETRLDPPPADPRCCHPPRAAVAVVEKDGAYCLFQSKAPQLKNDMIGLFQLHQADDPEHGGGYTVKRLKLSTRTDPEEG